MNYGYQGPPVNNCECPSAPTSFGPPYPTNDLSYPPSNSPYPPSNQAYSPCKSSYPPSNSSYPSSNQPYSPCNSSYPPSNPSYPSYNSTCHPSNPSYPQSRNIGFSGDLMTSNMLFDNIPHPNCMIPNPSQQTHCPQQQGPYSTPQTHQTSQQFDVDNLGASWSRLDLPSVFQKSIASFKQSPTVKPCSGFDPRRDAEALKKAMKRFGTNEKTLIEILARRVNSQRQEIALQFKTLFGKSLMKKIKSKTSGNLRDLLVALLTTPSQYYAAELHNALAGSGTKEIVLIEILCTVPNHGIRLISDAYQAMYRKRLEDHIRADKSLNFQRFLVALSLGTRDESSHVDQGAAQADVAQLFRAGKLRLGTEESVFHTIFTKRSWSQLKLIFWEYQELTGHSITEAIEKESSGYIGTALLAIVKSNKDRVEFFADELYKSMEGCCKDDNSLIRIIVTHCESDLGEIKDRFHCKYSKSLRDWVDSECSGDYKECLMALIG